MTDTQTQTVTLVSHPGERAYRGFGPKEYPLMGSEATHVATVGNARFVHVDHGDWTELLYGWPYADVLADLEVADDGTLVFDGELPFQDGGGCHAITPIFDTTHVYKRVPYGMLMLTVRDPTVQSWPRRARTVATTSVDDVMGWPAQVVRTAGHTGSVNLDQDTNRILLSIFEQEHLPEDVQPLEIEIGDESLARQYFDPTVALQVELRRAETAVYKAIDNLRSAVERGEELLVATDTSRMVIGRDGKPLVPTVKVDTTAFDRLAVIRWLIGLFDSPPATK